MVYCGFIGGLVVKHTNVMLKLAKAMDTRSILSASLYFMLAHLASCNIPLPVIVAFSPAVTLLRDSGVLAACAGEIGMLDMVDLRWDSSHTFKLFQNHGELPADEFSVAKTLWLCHNGRTGVRPYRPTRHLVAWVQGSSWGLEVSKNMTAISYTAALTSGGAYPTYQTLNHNNLNTQCQEQTQ